MKNISLNPVQKAAWSLMKNDLQFLYTIIKNQTIATASYYVALMPFIANEFRNSKGQWSYVGSSKYTYMAVGVMYDGYYWYVCVCMDSENTDLK